MPFFITPMFHGLGPRTCATTVDGRWTVGRGLRALASILPFDAPVISHMRVSTNPSGRSTRSDSTGSDQSLVLIRAFCNAGTRARTSLLTASAERQCAFDQGCRTHHKKASVIGRLPQRPPPGCGRSRSGRLKGSSGQTVATATVTTPTRAPCGRLARHHELLGSGVATRQRTAHHHRRAGRRTSKVSTAIHPRRSGTSTARRSAASVVAGQSIGHHGQADRAHEHATHDMLTVRDTSGRCRQLCPSTHCHSALGELALGWSLQDPIAAPDARANGCCMPRARRVDGRCEWLPHFGDYQLVGTMPVVVKLRGSCVPAPVRA